MVRSRLSLAMSFVPLRLTAPSSRHGVVKTLQNPYEDCGNNCARQSGAKNWERHTYSARQAGQGPAEDRCPSHPRFSRPHRVGGPEGLGCPLPPTDTLGDMAMGCT